MTKPILTGTLLVAQAIFIIVGFKTHEWLPAIFIGFLFLFLRALPKL